MVLEILGTRILAPSLGTTIEVWSAIITIILVSIAAGYFFGGALADKKQKSWILPAILLSSAFFVMLISFLKTLVLETFLTFPYGIRALWYSASLFMLPAFFLGSSTTYIIRNQIKKIHSVGSVNGKIYGISTVGSLLGVYTTSFYLVPTFAISSIITGLAALLFCTAFISFLNQPTSWED